MEIETCDCKCHGRKRKFPVVAGNFVECMIGVNCSNQACSRLHWKYVYHGRDDGLDQSPEERKYTGEDGG